MNFSTFGNIINIYYYLQIENTRQNCLRKVRSYGRRVSGVPHPLRVKSWRQQLGERGEGPCDNGPPRKLLSLNACVKKEPPATFFRYLCLCGHLRIPFRIFEFMVLEDDGTDFGKKSRTLKRTYHFSFVAEKRTRNAMRTVVRLCAYHTHLTNGGW